MTVDEQKKTGRRLWDYHGDILDQECKLHKARIANLWERWENKSREGFLPIPKVTGIFEHLTNLHATIERKLRFYSDPRLKRYEGRSFDEIIDMTDGLMELHFASAAAERCYWQRLEGYEAAAVDAVRRGTFSEVGTIQQVQNAADFLCMAYWDKVFGRRETDWCGIVTFGQFHEFRNWDPYVFAPDYVKLCNLQMWIYFAHELMHCAFRRLRSCNHDFQELVKDQVRIYSEVPLHLKIRDDLTLATETICDMMATLIAGVSFIQTLATLKYYPPVTVFSRQNFYRRWSGFPILLRTIISGWTTKIAWGLEQMEISSAPPRARFSIENLIKQVWTEDEIEHNKAMSFLDVSPSELQKPLSEDQDVKDVYQALTAVHAYELGLKWEVIPFVIKEILRKDIIPRVKSFIKDDYYHTLPSQYFYEIDREQTWTSSQIMQLDLKKCNRTASSSEIDDKKSKKNKHTQKLVNSMSKNQLAVDTNPVDIIACLNQLPSNEGSIQQSSYEHVAVLSISSQTEYHNRRFRMTSDR